MGDAVSMGDPICEVQSDKVQYLEQSFMLYVHVYNWFILAGLFTLVCSNCLLSV